MTTSMKGKRALVTGASSGLGVAFAKLLASWGADLIITARREENLQALAKELRDKHAVDVKVQVVDLSEPDGATKLWDATEGAGVTVDVLVNNAGGGLHRDFVDAPWDKLLRQLQLNVVSLTELTHRFARAMLARKQGWVLNVSSIGAYTPSPTYATYSAGKAYVRDMSEAIAHELRDTPVRVCCLCPGGTLTEFHQAAGHELPKIFRATFMSAEDCARIGLDALFAGRRNIISGITNALSMFLLRFLPRRLIVALAALTMGKPKGP
ncbi:MAG: SDR family oxidoreductase [Deltaproteobacteria bacterium]|nr:SDR family oxidoreductase [Deltaproteobacteria bacterium]